MRRKNIPYVSLSSIHHIPSKIGVIITSNREIHDIRFHKVIAADAYDSIDHAIDISLQMIHGKEVYSKKYIGIDPGDHPGIAIVCDDVLLQKIQVESPKKILSIVKRYLKEYPSDQTLIRIGNGSITIRNRIINSLIPLGVPIEIVDETRTTPHSQKTRDERDIEAAASIALITGGRIEKKLPVLPTKGEIRNIQEKSRKITNGKFSISEEIAKEVLNGKININDAVKKEEKRRKKT